MPTAAAATWPACCAFSALALWCVGALVASGTLGAWVQLGSVAALWGSAYGRTLLVKLGAVALVFAAGAYNWRRISPTLGDAAARLRRSAALELALGAFVLAVTAVLVATPPPGAE